MSKIKVLYTIPNFDTCGSGKALLNIARRINCNIFDPFICCRRKGGEFFEVVSKSGVPLIAYDYISTGENIINIILKSYSNSLYFRKYKFDIVHSFNYMSEYSEALCFKLSGSKWIYSKKNMSWNNINWKIRSLLADRIVALNSDMLNDFFPNSRRKVTLIPRGVDTEEFKPSRKNADILKKFDIPEQADTIITVANVIPRKGVLNLVEAFLEVVKEKKEVYLLILGDDSSDYARELKSRVKEAGGGFDRKVKFLGKQLDIALYYSIADVFVLPTSEEKGGEGCPVALLEAMSSGLVSFATDVPGSREVLRNFPEFLIPPDNPARIKERLNWYFKLSDDKKNEVSRKMRDCVVLNYSIEKEVKSHEGLYLSIVGK